MIDTVNVGLYISRLRKGSNMTQMQLADLLNISSQAVSKWERGESMPDIGMLPELARLFNISIDALLNANTKNEEVNNTSTTTSGFKTLIDGLSGSDLDKIILGINQAEIEIEKLVELAFIVPPQDLDYIVSRINPEKFSIKDLEKLVFYISESTASAIFLKLDPHNIRCDSFSIIVPFLTKDCLDYLFKHIDMYANKASLCAIVAPHLDRDIIATYFSERKPEEQDMALVSILRPHLIG